MAILSVEKVTMRFGGLVAVNDVSLHVEPGQIYSIIGPNGAGKTTVFNVVTGIYAPTQGNVRFEGKVRKRPLRWINLFAFLLVGLLGSILGFVAVVNIDSLWKATIKKQDAESFSYRKMLEDARAYIGGQMAIEPNSSGSSYRIIPPNSDSALAIIKELDQAIIVRDALQNGTLKIIEEDGRVTVLTEVGEIKIRARPFGSKAEYEEWRKKVDDLRASRESRREAIEIAMLGGFFLGIIASLVVWNRARQTTDYIALGGIARTFQNIRLFQNMTAMENVLVGMDRNLGGNIFSMALRLPSLQRREREAEAKAEELLHFVGLRGIENRLAKNLPYGDQRRLEIARAMACEPRLLLLDEPAAGMNPSETVDLMGLIRRIRDRGLTVLVIEHHMSLVMGISDRIAVLDYGVKIAEGTPQEVRDDPRVIEAYLGKEEVS